MAQTDVATQYSAGTIAAYFEDSNDARRAVDALQDAGFTSAHLGIAHRHSAVATTDYGTTTGQERVEEGPSTWEKIKSWFTGEDPSTYESTSTRELTANSYGSSYDDDSYYDEESGLDESLTAINIPEDRARYFYSRLQSGRSGAIVTLQAGERRAEAEAILARYNADFGESAATYDYSAGQTGTADQPEKIQLLGEVLRVHKDRVNRGEVRVRKEVVTENQTVQVPVEREELVIERNPVGENTPATGNIGESEIRVPLSEEQARVSKSAVVREEVSVGKKPTEQVRDINSTVRHEELVVDDETKPEPDKLRRTA